MRLSLASVFCAYVLRAFRHHTGKMAPREIAYDLSLHIYSPPFANTSRKRLSGDDTQSFDAERQELKPNFFSLENQG